MPIYEFYCVDCHTIYKFFSRRINTETKPNCPKCGRSELERCVSLFAISKGRKEGDDGDPLDQMDEHKLEQAMAAMASEMEGIDENDPKQAARMMRKLFGATGLPLGPGMEEAMRRMEAGEDPDQIEAELGDVLEEEDPFSGKIKQPIPNLKSMRRELVPPKHDETLYDL